MRIAVVGGGPAGLYFATLWKKRHPDSTVRVFEQNPADATFGFGVVFSERALEFLRDDDPETHDLITPEMETWQDMTLVHRGERVVIDGVGFPRSVGSSFCSFCRRARSMWGPSWISKRQSVRLQNSVTTI